MAPREHRTPAGGNTSSAQQVPSSVPMGLAVLDAFTQVAEVLEEARRQHSALVIAIEDMPSYGRVFFYFVCRFYCLKTITFATLIY